MRAQMLSGKDKLAIASAMFALSRGLPDAGEDFLSWLRRHGQAERHWPFLENRAGERAE